MTILQQIRDAIIAALNESGTPVEFTTRRWKADRALDEDETSAAVLFHNERVQRAGGPGSTTVKRDHQFAIQVVTTTEDPADIDDALEIMRDWMVNKLGGNKLNGLSHELEEGPTTWETATLERVHGAFITLWTAPHQTKINDLTQRH